MADIFVVIDSYAVHCFSRQLTLYSGQINSAAIDQ